MKYLYCLLAVSLYLYLYIKQVIWYTYTIYYVSLNIDLIYIYRYRIKRVIVPYFSIISWIGHVWYMYHLMYDSPPSAPVCGPYSLWNYQAGEVLFYTTSNQKVGEPSFPIYLTNNHQCL